MSFHISSRNRQITRRVLQGESCQRVARDYPLCKARVRQITIETVDRLFPAQPQLAGLGLRRLRTYAWWVLPVLEPRRQEETA